jgi:hypothetical protein
MDRKILVAIIVVIAVLAIFLAGPNVQAQEVFPGPYAQTIFTATSIRWEVLEEHNGTLLSISGPQDFSHQATFSAEETPAFRLDGPDYPEGSYWYELRLLPVLTEETRGALSEIDDEGRGETVTTERAQYGSFRIAAGAFIHEAIPEGPITRDIGHLDDVYITGSLCVGFDCVNGSAYGSTTQALSENNLRMMFLDTSTSASFPNNDWAFYFNDQTNGGANFFAISDCGTGADVDLAGCGTYPFMLQAGAPANTLMIESTGDIGIDTTNPVLELHIHDGDSPGVRLDQSGGGWGTYTWDIAGNEANFFIRDITGGSTLPFRIRPGAPSSSIDISASGNVGIGTSSPQEKLHIADGNLLVDGYVTEFSDKNAKENFSKVNSREILELVATLPLSTWNYKTEDPSVRHIGPMAQDFYAAFSLGTGDTHIAPLDTNGVALAAIQALNQDLEAKASEIEVLKQENEALGRRLVALEQAVAGQEKTTPLYPLQVLTALTLSVLFWLGWCFTRRWKLGALR